MTSGQVTRLQKEEQCQVQISIIFMHPSHPPFLTDFFQSFRMCLVHRVAQHIVRFLYIADLRSAGGHDSVMPSLRENILNSFYSGNNRDICLFSPLFTSITQDVTITTSLSFSVCCTYPSVGSNKANWGQVTFLLITYYRIKIELPKWYHCALLEQSSRMVCNTSH